MPINPYFISLFATKLAEDKRSNTIQGYLSAIAFMHIKAGVDDTTKNPSVSLTLQGIKRTEPVLLDKKLKPIEKDLLHTMVEAIPFSCFDVYSCSLVKSLFLLTFYACLRAGEIVHSDKTDHTQCLKHLKEHNNSYTITFESYKHSGQLPPISDDQDSELPQIVLHALEDKVHCPVRALKAFLRMRGGKSGPIFINKEGQPIKRTHLTNWMKKTLEMAGMPPARYNTHSFRIGRTTQLARDGYSDEIIRRTGRWKSNAYKDYIRINTFQLPK